MNNEVLVDERPLPYPVDPRILPQQGTDLRWILRRALEAHEEPLPWTAGGLYMRRADTADYEVPTPASTLGAPLHKGKELDALEVGADLAISLGAKNCMNRDMSAHLKTIRSQVQLLLTCQDQWLRYNLHVHVHQSIMDVHALGATIIGRAKSPLAALEDYASAGVTFTEINGVPTGCRP